MNKCNTILCCKYDTLSPSRFHVFCDLKLYFEISICGSNSRYNEFFFSHTTNGYDQSEEESIFEEFVPRVPLVTSSSHDNLRTAFTSNETVLSSPFSGQCAGSILKDILALIMTVRRLADIIVIIHFSLGKSRS